MGQGTRVTLSSDEGRGESSRVEEETRGTAQLRVPTLGLLEKRRVLGQRGTRVTRDRETDLNTSQLSIDARRLPYKSRRVTCDSAPWTRRFVDVAGASQTCANTIQTRGGHAAEICTSPAPSYLYTLLLRTLRCITQAPSLAVKPLRRQSRAGGEQRQMWGIL